jgi:hypothetical protein
VSPAHLRTLCRCFSIPQHLLTEDGQWGVMEVKRWDAFLDWLSGAGLPACLPPGLLLSVSLPLLSRVTACLCMPCLCAACSVLPAFTGPSGSLLCCHQQPGPSQRLLARTYLCPQLCMPVPVFLAADSGLLTTKVQSRDVKVKCSAYAYG